MRTSIAMSTGPENTYAKCWKGHYIDISGDSYNKADCTEGIFGEKTSRERVTRINEREEHTSDLLINIVLVQ